MKKILLIDGNGLIFRAYFATATRMSMNNQGVPTNAIYLFSSILMKLLEKRDFDDIMVALDSPGKKFRHKEYQNYKANRKEVPLELKLQFEPIKEFLNICNIKTIEIEGYEADDIIGTITSHAKEHNVKIEVYTGDKDLLQLINDNTIVNMMHKGLSEVEAFDEAHLKEVYGIRPLQIIDVKSLMGDTSDNIPGVKGVGEKTAYDLIYKYDTLNGIYEHIEEIKGKLKEKLINPASSRAQRSPSPGLQQEPSRSGRIHKRNLRCRRSSNVAVCRSHRVQAAGCPLRRSCCPCDPDSCRARGRGVCSDRP
jgi:DNA polymerase-1